ncbi:MAG: TA system VapC family ribonuclease toxin [Candidatus Sulfotelmatobacter sp.]
MIVVDTNLLIYAYNSGSTHHAKARRWLEHTLSGSESVGLPWQSTAAFVRIMTDVRLPAEHLTALAAVEVVNGWLDQAIVRLLTPGEDHWSLFRQMVLDGQAAGNLVSDAQIAALTIEYGGVLYTTDRDFARFPGLRWRNPLE